MLFKSAFQTQLLKFSKYLNVSGEFYWKSKGLVVPIHVIAWENISSYPSSIINSTWLRKPKESFLLKIMHKYQHTMENFLVASVQKMQHKMPLSALKEHRWFWKETWEIHWSYVQDQHFPVSRSVPVIAFYLCSFAFQMHLTQWSKEIHPAAAFPASVLSCPAEVLFNEHMFLGHR